MVEGGTAIAGPEVGERGHRTPRPAAAAVRERHGAESWARSLALLAIAGVIGWFVAYAMQSSGASRVAALFAAGLVAMGSLLLGWSYVRRPIVGQNDDALDKLLAGAGQALLLGAVLTFGFGIVGQHLDDERAGLDRQRAGERAPSLERQILARAVRDAARGTDYRGSDLASQHLSGLDMHGLDLSAADLTFANLTDSNLSGADLTGANLRFTDLSGADLTRADLADADLVNANVRYVHLSGADLGGADLSGANLTGSILRDARLSGLPHHSLGGHHSPRQVSR